MGSHHHSLRAELLFENLTAELMQANRQQGCADEIGKINVFFFNAWAAKEGRPLITNS